jgi:hypothetical protein
MRPGPRDQRVNPLEPVQPVGFRVGHGWNSHGVSGVLLDGICSDVMLALNHSARHSGLELTPVSFDMTKSLEML